MARKIELEIRAKNALARGLSSAGAALKKFGQSAVRIGKAFAVGFLAAGAAVAGFVAKALQAYARQEKAERDLATAFELHGESVADLLPKYKKLASAIQDQTGVADELTLSRMASLRMLGVEENQLEAATKALIGLTRAGMSDEAAQRALTAAAKGNFEALRRYVPALRTARTEQEKIAIVNDFVSKQYEAARRDLKTVTTAWGAFKGRIGDVWEELGKAITRLVDIPGLLRRAGDAVKGFGERVSQWIESKRFQALKESIEGVLDAMRKGGGARAEVAKALGEVVIAAFARAAEIAVDVLQAAAPRIGKLIGAAAKMAMGAIFQERDLKKAAKDLGIEVGFSFGAFGVMRGITDAQKDMIRQQAQINRQAEIYKELGIEAREVTDGETAAQVRLKNAVAALTAVAAKHRDERAAATDDELGAAEKLRIAAENLAEAEERRAKMVEESDRRQFALEKEIADEEKRLAQEKIDRIKEQIDAKEELARATVDAFLAEKRAGEDEQKRQQKEWDRFRRLEGIESKRGRKLSKADQEWLDAFRAIEDAGQAGVGLHKELVAAQAQLAQQMQQRTLSDMLTQLELVHRDLSKNLQAAGV